MCIRDRMKIDPETGGKRKLSKRKDPELALTFYEQEGYPVPAVLEYLMTLLNSNFEEWRRANPDLPMNDFPFSTKKMSGSGALFDIEKLHDVSKNVISRMSADTVYDLSLIHIYSSWKTRIRQVLPCAMSRSRPSRDRRGISSFWATYGSRARIVCPTCARLCGRHMKNWMAETEMKRFFIYPNMRKEGAYAVLPQVCDQLQREGVRLMLPMQLRSAALDLDVYKRQRKRRCRLRARSR